MKIIYLTREFVFDSYYVKFSSITHYIQKKTINTQLILYNFILVITLFVTINIINFTQFILININHYYNNNIQK